MALRHQSEASHAASCFLFTEGIWQDWESVTHSRHYMTVAAWTGAQDCSALCDAAQVAVTQRHSQERRHSCRIDCSGFSKLFTTFFFFVCVFLLFGSFFFFYNTQPFCPERGWDFPSYYALQWIPVAQCLARDLRISPFMCATGRNPSSSRPGLIAQYGCAWFHSLIKWWSGGKLQR